jgi:cytochrome b561
MADTSTTSRYSAPAQIFHWLTVILVLGAWTLGTIGDDLPKGSIRELGESIHVILGETVLLLLVLRLAWRFVTPVPGADPGSSPMVIAVAKYVHLAIYALLSAVPIMGVVTLFYGGEPLPIFGVFDIASPWPKSRDLKHSAKEIHEFLANLLLALAALHAAAALMHHYFLKDGTLKRMLPAALTGD